jgi:hypothetical protein
MGQSHGNLHPKQWEVVRRKKNTPGRLTLSDGRAVTLNRKINTTIVKDAGLARAIDQEYGPRRGGTGDVMVVECDNNHLHERENVGHHYTFQVPALPWHKYDEDGNRIK